MAESGGDKISEQLSKHGLNDPKWLKAFRKMKVTDIENIQDKESKFDLLSAIAVGRETFCLRKALGISGSGVEELNVILEDADLDVGYWSRVFSEQFGVVSAQGIENMTGLLYPHLVQFSRSPTEQRALKSILKINEDGIELHEHYDKYLLLLKERASQMKCKLEKLESYQSEQREIENEEVQTLYQQLVECFQVPKQFFPPFTAYDTCIATFRDFYELMNPIPCDQIVLEDSKIIEKASDGLALKGVLKHSNNESPTQNVVLEVPEGVVLQMPFYSQSIRHSHCNGKQEEELVLKLTRGMQLPRMKAHTTETDYFSTIKVFYVPIASCFFKPTQLSLSQEAIEALKNIESINEPDEVILIKCKSFLEQFGSHVHLGPFHFGGTYTWHCFSCGLKEQDRITARDLQGKVIEVHECMLNPPKHPKVEFDVVEFQCSKEIYEKTSLKISTNGGIPQPETGGMPPLVPVVQWRNHLMANKSSWVLLDCGTELYSIWDIISKNHDEIPPRIVNKLKEAWQGNFGLAEEVRDWLPMEGLDYSAEELKKKIATWIIEKDPSTCCEHLRELTKVKKSVLHVTLDSEAWPKYYLALPQIQDYLMQVVDMCKTNRTDECEVIKPLMLQVIGPADIESVPNFQHRDFIQSWVFDVDQPCSCFKSHDLTIHMEYCFDVALRDIHCNDGALYECLANPDTTLNATAIIRSSILHLQRHFQRTDQIYDYLFITTLILPFYYAVIYIRSSSDINVLCNLFKKHTDSFYELKKSKNVLKLQAYLASLAIEVSKEVDIGASSRMYAHLQVVLQTLGESIFPAVKNVIQTIMTDVKATERAETILSIVMENSEKQEIETNIAKAAEPWNPGMVAKIFDILLLILDLTKCYPQKMTLSEALAIREHPIEFDSNNICPDKSLYASMIIKQILSFDHRCFIKLANTTVKNRMEQLQTTMTVFISKEGEVAADLNPLDGLITVLLCADNFLRQHLMCRLAACQIAIPLVLPDPMGDLTLTLWAMRTIVKQWEVKSAGDAEECQRDVSIISYPTPIISFLRFGTHNISKSKLVNIAMEHNTFFHYDCDGGSSPKYFTDGMIDAAWHIPSADSSFGDAVTFLNLHGDARTLKTQVKFLSEVSFMHFILLNVEEIDKVGSEVLQQLSKAAGGVVLLHSGKTLGLDKREGMNVIELNSRNEAKKRDDMRKKMIESITRKWKDHKTVSYEDAACHCGIAIDENNPDCAQGKELANKMHLMLAKEKNPKRYLPLQGEMYWHKVAKNEKEECRQQEGKVESVRKHSERLKLEIAQTRNEQYECVKKLDQSVFLKPFLCNLRKMSNNGIARNYYIRWIKIYLDDLSRENLPRLHSEYHKMKEALQNEEESKGKCKAALKKLNMELINASFGLEHLLREVGQIYEASKFFQSNQYDFLPDMMAELMIDGYPLELMDGDTAHVPLHWVEKVLNILRERLKNPSILVFSILGVQSSGKSTLLNTLFGVNFNVSAGRCTRGAFMQLIPFHSSFKRAQYLLLVDTEGLRAPELDIQKTHNHDNMLGTFVIGLANLTVINIYGEVSSDMNDIIQTAVHAFLRMKHVTHSSPYCYFVYQNVAAVKAGEKAMMGRKKIKENLDEMTKLAAEEEGLEGEYTCLNDVIQFDEDKNVAYFPALWYGNPPMAPVNPEYSAKAKNLKQCLTDCAKQSRTVNLSDFIENLRVFWKAILHENFIFNFRNTLEMSVFSALDMQRNKWSWHFREEVMISEEKFETEIHNIKACNRKLEEKAYSMAKAKVIRNVSAKYSTLVDEMNQFFKTHPQKEIMIRWKSNTVLMMESLHKELESHATQFCQQVWQSRNAKLKVEEIKSGHQIVISKNVMDLVSQLDRNDMLSESDPKLKEKFEEQWKEWIKVLEAQMTGEFQERLDIELEVERTLTDYFKKQSHIVINKIDSNRGGKTLEEWGATLQLIIEDGHVLLSSQPSLKDRIKRKFYMKESWRHLAEVETADYLQSVRTYLVSKQNKNYNPSFITEILTLLRNRIDMFRCDMFRFTTEYSLDLALTACGYALIKFKEMSERYRNENDPVKCLEREKAKYFQDFCDEYSQVAREIIAARQCCEILERAIEKKVFQHLPLRVVQKLEKDEQYSFLSTKSALIKRALKFIATELQNNKFTACSKYIRYPHDYLEDYVKQVTDSFCDEGNPSHLTLFARELVAEVMKLLRNTIKSIKENYQGRFTLSDWMKNLRTKLSQTLIIDGTIRCESSDKNDDNLEFFTTKLQEQLNIMEDNLIKKCNLTAKHMESWDQTPYGILFDRVCGCKEVCPFCKEPCKGFKGHGGDHSVNLHRPICLGGWRIRETGVMVLKTCTMEVAEDRSFYVRPDSDKTHPFRTCEEVYPRWHIDESLPREASLYWKYVVAHFKSELAKLYDMKEDSAPDHWMGFELSQALEAL